MLNFGFYFGYGAFASKEELKRFIPFSISLGKYTLHRHKSGYCVVSKDGQYATYGIQQDKDSSTRGRLYFINNFKKLDVIEGKDRYSRKLVFVNHIIPAYIYIPLKIDWDLSLLPSPKYKTIIDKEILEVN